MERVELLPVYSSEQVEGALTLQALALLPYAHSPTIPSPSTSATLEVPYGGLLGYAQHLIDEAGRSDIQFQLRFHHFFGDMDDPTPPEIPATAEVLTQEQLAELKSQGKILDLNDPEVQQAIQTGKIVIKTS